MRIVAVFLLLLALPGVTPAQSLDSLLPQEHSLSRSAARPLPLAEIEAAALENNPEIRLMSERVALARSQTAGTLSVDDPSFAYRAWGTPLLQPWNMNQTQHMFMFSQTIPASGKRELRFEAANQAVEVAEAELEAAKRDITMQTRMAFYELLRNYDELRLHDEQIALARQAVSAVQIQYTVGRVPQQDVLKAQVALTRLADHLVMFLQDGELARLSLNTLMGRSPTTALEITGEHLIPSALPENAQLQQIALENRPDLEAIAASIRESETKVRLADRNNKPDIAISAGYMLMPSGSKNRNGYIAELSFNLPGLNRSKHDAEIQEARSAANVQRAELEVRKASIFREIQEASIRANSARRLVDLYGQTLRPQADATLRATTIAFQAGQSDFLSLIDSQNSVLDVEYSNFRALAEFDTRIAELERAIGAPIPRDLPVRPEASHDEK